MWTSKTVRLSYLKSSKFSIKAMQAIKGRTGRHCTRVEARFGCKVSISSMNLLALILNSNCYGKSYEKILNC